MNQHPDNSTDVASSYWTGTGWSPEAQVNRPDSTDLDFAPHIACGGGQVWCVWYGGPTDMSPYRVYASRWNESAGAWEPEMQVSTSDSCYNWWCNVVVDGSGRPHVVWCQYPHYLLRHSYYDGTRWHGPFAVNDTNLVGASPWASPEIAVDRSGNLHVSYTGALRGASHRDVFYTSYGGTSWSPSAKVSQDTQCDEWYSGIACDRPDNVWVAWDRQGGGPDQFRVYASHYDGTAWSPEGRLDDETSHFDHVPQIGIDSTGYPWVVWSGICNQSGSFDIFHNRYGLAGTTEPRSSAVRTCLLSLRASNLSTGDFVLSYQLPSEGIARIEVYDKTGKKVRTIADDNESAGIHTARWDACDGGGRPASSGIYLCRLETGNSRATCKLVLLVR